LTTLLYVKHKIKVTLANYFNLDSACLFHHYPPVNEKATVALYFGRFRTRLGVVHFRVFRLFLWLLTT